MRTRTSIDISANFQNRPALLDDNGITRMAGGSAEHPVTLFTRCSRESETRRSAYFFLWVQTYFFGASFSFLAQSMMTGLIYAWTYEHNCDIYVYIIVSPFALRRSGVAGSRVESRYD